MSTTISGTLVEIHDAFIVLSGPTYIMVPPGMKVDLVIGEALSVTATSQSGTLDRSAHRARPRVMALEGR